MSKPSDATSDFIAFIPQQIDPGWDEKYGPLLAGFPLNLAYAKARNSNAGSNPESVVYWPDPGTYRQNSDHREICYFTKHPNGYRVRVIHDMGSGKWRTEKFRGDKLICSGRIALPALGHFFAHRPGTPCDVARQLGRAYLGFAPL